MVIKTIAMLKRNFQISLNTKASSLILILSPLILIGLMGFALQDVSMKNIKVSLFMDEKDSFSDTFIGRLEEQGYSVEVENSLEICKNKVKNAKSHVCIHLQKEYTPSLNYPMYNLDLNVDFSKQRVVWQIIGTIQGIAEQESYKAREGFVTDLKQDSQELSKKLEIEEARIDTAVREIDYLRNLLRDVESQSQDIDSAVFAIDSNLTIIKNNLVVIQNSGLLIGQDLVFLTNSLNLINGIQNQLILIETDTGKSINNIETRLTSARGELRNTQNSLRDMREGLNTIRDTDIESISEPISVSYKSVLDETEGEIKNKLESLDYLFPSFTMFFILFGSIVFASVLRIRERSSSAYVRNIASKIKGSKLILSDFMTCSVLMIIQIIIIFVTAYFFLNISLLQNIFVSVALILIAISLFTLIGIAIGSILNTQESVIIASISLCILFFIFSSIIVPVEILPKALSTVISLFPLTLLESKLRLALIFNGGIGLNLFEIAGLLTTGIISSLLIFIFYKKNKEREL